jgi:spectrin alpha
LSSQRKVKLSEALKLQQFLRDVDEAEAWIQEKMQSAKDMSYRDPTNLQGKLQKHIGFEAEIAANEERITAILKRGEDLVTSQGTGADVVHGRIVKVDQLWQELCEQSQDKGQKLKEANNQQQYNYNVDDVEFWLSEVELLLSSKDLGKDLLSVQNLIKKHQLIQADLVSHKDRIDAVNAQADDFVAAKHFDSENIRLKQTNINSRYTELVKLGQLRSHALEESLKAHRIFRDIDDEESWIKEKQRIVGSTDFGKDLTGVQNLQKKHDTFDAELRAHNPHVDSVLNSADALISAKHMASTEIQARRATLASLWGALKVIIRLVAFVFVPHVSFRTPLPFAAASSTSRCSSSASAPMLTKNPRGSTRSSRSCPVMNCLTPFPPPSLSSRSTRRSTLT